MRRDGGLGVAERIAAIPVRPNQLPLASVGGYSTWADVRQMRGINDCAHVPRRTRPPGASRKSRVADRPAWASIRRYCRLLSRAHPHEHACRPQDSGSAAADPSMGRCLAILDRHTHGAYPASTTRLRLDRRVSATPFATHEGRRGMWRVDWMLAAALRMEPVASARPTVSSHYGPQPFRRHPETLEPSLRRCCTRPAIAMRRRRAVAYDLRISSREI